MSVVKLQKGDTINYVSHGEKGKKDLDDIDSRLDAELRNSGLNKKVQDRVYELMGGVRAGNISFKNNQLIDKSGTFGLRSDSKNLTREQRRQRKIDEEAARYLYDFVGNSTEFVAPEAVEPELKQFNLQNVMDSNLAKRFNQSEYNEQAAGAFSRLDDENSYTNRTAALNEAFGAALQELETGNYDYSKGLSKEALQQRIREAQTRLSDNTFDINDLRAWDALGIQDKYFNYQKQQAEPGKPVEDKTFTRQGFKRVTVDGKPILYRGDQAMQDQLLMGTNVFDPTYGQYEGSVIYKGNIYGQGEYDKLPEDIRANAISARQAQYNAYSEIPQDDLLFGGFTEQGFKKSANLSSNFSGINPEESVHKLFGEFNPAGTQSAYSYTRIGESGNPENITGDIKLNSLTGTYQFLPTDGSQPIELGGIKGDRLNYEKTQYLTPTHWANAKDPEEIKQLSIAMREILNMPGFKGSKTEKSASQAISHIIKSGKAEKFNMKQRKDGAWVMNTPTGNIVITPEGVDFASGQLPKLGGDVTYKFTRDNDVYSTDFRPSFKVGGVIKAQWGASLVKKAEKSYNPETAEKEGKAYHNIGKANKLNLDATSGDTDFGGEVTTADKLKLAGAFADLGGAAVSFIPGAHIAGAGLGLLGTSLNATAQSKELGGDGFGWDDLGNTALNLGMDAVSLIPGGGLLKASKAAKAIKGMLPVVSTALLSVGMFDTDQRQSIMETMGKITSGNLKSLDSNDLNNITIAINVLRGGHRTLQNSPAANRLASKVGRRVNYDKTSIESTIGGNKGTTELNSADVKGKTSKEVRELIAKKNNIKPDDVSIAEKGPGFSTRMKSKVPGKIGRNTDLTSTPDFKPVYTGKQSWYGKALSAATKPSRHAEGGVLKAAGGMSFIDASRQAKNPLASILRKPSIQGTADIVNFVDTSVTNKRVMDKMRGLQPLTLNPVNYTKPQLTGDLTTKGQMYNQAADVESFVRNGRQTASAEHNLAGALEAKRMGNQYRQQGNLADISALKQSQVQINQLQNTQEQQNAQIAMGNAERINAMDNAKINMEAAKLVKDHANRFKLIASGAQRLDLQKQKQDQFKMGQLEQKANIDYETGISSINSKYDKLFKPYLNLSEEERKANQSYQTLLRNKNLELERLRKSTYEPMLNAHKEMIGLNKRGGNIENVAKIKAKMQNAKEFNNTINNSTKSVNVLLSSLSDTTKQLILNATKK